MDTETVGFTADGFRLRGVLHRPAKEAPGGGLVVGSHGLFSDGDSPKQIALAERLNRRGIAFFRFDHRGCGQSEGGFSEVTSLEGRCRDVEAAVRMLRDRQGIGGPLGLFGSSMGGAVCISAAARFDFTAMVTLAAPVRIRTDGDAMSAIRRSGDASATDPAFYRRDLTFDLSDQLSALHHILVIHGEADEIIPLANAREIHRNAGEPKRLIVQKGGDHRVSDAVHQEEFMAAATDWFSRYLAPDGR
jgi:hypothetical protein